MPVTILIIATTVFISFICFKRKDLFYKLCLNPYAMMHHKEWSRFITHGFVHADGTHLLVNMFTFWSFGSYIESDVYLGEIEGGIWFYIGLYFGGLIASSLYDVFKYKDFPGYNSVGASGAVSAILFTCILLDPWSGIYLFLIPIPIPGIIFGALYLFYCQYMARRSDDNINHNAHFYGAVYGFVYPLLWNWKLIVYFFNQLLDLPY